MEFSLRYYCSKGVELTINTFNTTITEDLTDVYGLVNEDLITNLEDVIEQLKEHNTKIKGYG